MRRVFALLGLLTVLAFPAAAQANVQDGGGGGGTLCYGGVMYAYTSVGWVPIGYC